MGTMIVVDRHEVFISGMQFEQQLKSGSMSILEVAPIAARLGAVGVEYRDIYWKNKAIELPAVRDQLHALGLKAAYAIVTGLYNRDQAQRSQLLQDLEDARTLGARIIRVFRGERVTEPEDTAMLEAGRAFVRRAEGYGMEVALENTPSPPGSTIDEIGEVLEQIDSPALGTNLDFANYARNDEDPSRAIEQFASRILFSHLKDVRVDPQGRKNVYLGGGTGYLPLKGLLEALVATGRSFPFCFEFQSDGDPEGEIARSMQYLAALGLESK